jgi:small subunit ribosomal protein S17
MTDAPNTDNDETRDDAPAGDGGGPQEQLSPKERRRRRRAKAGGSPRPRTPEERAAARQRRKEQRRRWRVRARERERAREKTAPQPAAEAGTGRRRERQGVVVSAKPDKTITVRIDVARRHRRYEKIVRESATLHAHDERNEAREGDTVRVVESRPLSRTKRWRLLEVMERAR